MRKIKFRAWDKEDNKMWKVVRMSDSIWGESEEDAHVLVCDFGKSPEDKNTYVGLSVNYELMQYTGLKDVNGREIYEGDVIEIEYIEDEVKTLHQVVWGGNEYPAWDVKPYWDGECNVFSDVYCSGYYKMKVIGNIYEHSHLLEG